MPEQTKGGKKGRKINRAIKKCARYKAADRRGKNRKRREDKRKRHFLLAAARRYRNHPDKASTSDQKAFIKLTTKVK
jgi:hypothetical protein